MRDHILTTVSLMAATHDANDAQLVDCPIKKESRTSSNLSERVRQQLTIKERDIETGLDYFLARYYSSIQGRFTSPDAPFMDQHEIDPQSWNLYTYVGNNPLLFTDTRGLWKWVDPDNNGNRFLQWEEGDDWQTLATFLNNNSNDTYYTEDLEEAFSSGGHGEGTIVDVTGAIPRFTNTRGVDSSVSWDLVPSVVARNKLLRRRAFLQESRVG